MDFSAILAKANKNAQNAQKILKQKEEEKQIKLKKPPSNTNVVVNNDKNNKKVVIDEVRRKAEEAKRRAEQETRELLEKRLKKVEALKKQQDINKKPIVTTKPKLTTTTPKSTTKEQVKPKVSTSNSTKTQKSRTSSANVPPKKPLSYNDMLKLADEIHKGTKSATTTTTQFKKPLDVPPVKSQIVKSKSNNDINASVKKPATTQKRPNLNGSLKNVTTTVTTQQAQKSNGKHFLPGDIRNKGLNTSTQSLNIPKTTPQKPQTKTAAPISQKPVHTSAWDRVTSDIKKKTNVKINNGNEYSTANKKRHNPSHTQSNIDDNIYYDDDEDEYDSEMDDFIDDEEEDNEDVRKEIRKIFKYDPRRYKDIDDSDLANMESSYHDIMKEERKSAKIGYIEDLEDMRLEEEEKRKKQIKKQRTD